jgi:hypothetical protein
MGRLRYEHRGLHGHPGHWKELFSPRSLDAWTERGKDLPGNRILRLGHYAAAIGSLASAPSKAVKATIKGTDAKGKSFEEISIFSKP